MFGVSFTQQHIRLQCHSLRWEGNYNPEKFLTFSCWHSTIDLLFAYVCTADFSQSRIYAFIFLQELSLPAQYGYCVGGFSTAGMRENPSVFFVGAPFARRARGAIIAISASDGKRVGRTEYLGKCFVCKEHFLVDNNNFKIKGIVSFRYHSRSPLDCYFQGFFQSRGSSPLHLSANEFRKMCN